MSVTLSSHTQTAAKLIRTQFLAFLLLATMSACGHAKEKLEDLSMQNHETEEVEWGVDAMSYSVDSEGAALSILPNGRNWLEDSRGNYVGGFSEYARAGFWQGGDTPFGGNEELARLPKKMHLQYYDYQEGGLYQLDVELPQKTIYDLLKQERVDYYAGFTGGILHYNRILLGFAPKGHVFVWVGGGSDLVEIAHYQSKIVPFDFDNYNNSVSESERLNPDLLLSSVTPETLAKLQSGWRPSPDLYLQYRVKYPWKIALSDNVKLVDYNTRNLNMEGQMVFAREMDAEQQKLKSPPKFLDVYFTDKAGQRYWLNAKLFDDTVERVRGEEDLSEIIGAFQKLFPNRSSDDNDATVSDAEFGALQLDVADDMQHVSISVQKNGVSIPLKTLSYAIKPIQPHVFDDSTPPLSPENLKRVLYGPHP